MAFRRSFAYKTTLKSLFFGSKITYMSSSSSSCLRILKQAPSTEKLFHKDWLSPIEVVKIFNTAEPNSVLALLNHVSKRKDFKPSEALYTVVITKLGQARNFDAIDDILKMIKTQKNCSLSDCFFYNVIKIYGNVGGLVDRAIETLFDMPSYDCWPSVKTFNFVLNLLVSSKRFDAAHRLYLGASHLWVEVDACTLNILIKGLCQCGCLEDALHVLDEYPMQGCSPNKLTFSTIMHCMCEKGMVDEAFGLVERMEKEGVSPDAVTFNILVSGLQKQGRVEEAMDLLDRMKLKGCEPNKGTYQEVLYGLLKANKFTDARDFVRQMRSKSLIPSFLSYKLLIMGLCDENLLGDVDWVLRSMASVGFVPRMEMWRRVLEKMFPSQHSPNTLFQ
uniref:Uncharacterized protein n=3 Tax=Opuntia streptacantha TaxID=393608 RepID=A0A7C9E6Y0_OPUST